MARRGKRTKRTTARTMGYNKDRPIKVKYIELSAYLLRA
jgi:hypothetical protein